MKKRILCILLAAVMSFALFPALGMDANAASSQQQQIINAAISHIGDTASAFPDVNFDWCVYFTNYCASEAGLASPASSPRSKIFPPITEFKANDWAATGVTYQANWFSKYSHGKVYYFKDSDLIDKNKNTIKTDAAHFEPIPGDLIYIDHTEYAGVYNHVALVYDYDEANRLIYYIGGNQGNGNWKYSNVSCREIELDSIEVAGFLRPNYTTKYEKPPVLMGSAPEEGAGCRYDRNTCPSRNFKDVTTASWYHQSLDYCVAHNLFKGTSADGFTPNATMTRGMMIMVLYRLDGSPDASGLNNPFKDVDSKTWCVDAIKWAYDTGVTEGFKDNTFGTDIKITRAQAAKMLFCFALYKNLDCSKIKSYKSYADADQVGDWAADAMQWSLGNGIIQGVSETRLNPNGNATRAQLAAILARYAQYYDIFGESAPEPTDTPEPTVTPEPTATPEPAAAPRTMTTPKPAATPEPIATPEPSEVPEATETPIPTETVIPTETPIET